MERSKRQIGGRRTSRLCSIRRRMSARRASIRSAFTSPTRLGRRFSEKQFRKEERMLSLRIVITVTLSSAWMQSAQSQPAAKPPIGAKRVPPSAPGQTPPKSIPPILQQYDFGGQLRTLEDSGSLPADVKPEFATPGVTSGAVPKDFRPKADVPLTTTALEAVRVSERWQGEKNAPSPGHDGRNDVLLRS